MNKLKTIIDLVNQGDKAKLWKYLNKGIYSKKDKIDVVKSKGGQGGENTGGKGEWKYINANINDENASSLLAATMFASLVKVDNGDGTKSVYPAGYQSSQLPNAKALALGISWDAKIALHGIVMTIGEGLSASVDLSALTFLTEEEFYNIGS